MSKPSITIRPAIPTFEEGLKYAHYLDEAAEGFFRFMFGRRVAKIIGEAYTQPHHNYSYENVVFAEYDARIVGMASGFTTEQHSAFSDQPVKEAAGPRAIRMRTVNTICAPLIRILNTLTGGDFYLLSVATDKELRGKGIGSVLMDTMEERAVANGCARFALDVSASNEGACRLYERRGMTVESQWPKRMFIPGLRLYRMAKPLANSG